MKNTDPTPEQDHPVSAEHSAWLAWSEAYAKKHFQLMGACPPTMPVSERKERADRICEQDADLRELHQKWQDILAQEKKATPAPMHCECKDTDVRWYGPGHRHPGLDEAAAGWYCGACLQRFVPVRNTPAPLTPTTTSYTAEELAIMADNWMTHAFGHPKEMTKAKQSSWLRDNGLIHLFLRHGLNPVIMRDET